MTYHYQSQMWQLQNSDSKERHWISPNRRQSAKSNSASYYVQPTEVIDFAEVCLMEDITDNVASTQLHDDLSSSESASKKNINEPVLPALSKVESFISESCAGESVEGDHYIHHVGEADSIYSEDLTTDDDNDDSYESESLTHDDEDEELLDKLLDGDFAMMPLEAPMASSYSGSNVGKSNDGSLATSEVLIHNHDPFGARYGSPSSNSTVSSIQPASTEYSNSTSRRSMDDHPITSCSFSASTLSRQGHRYDLDDIDAIDLLERAHERLERQSLQDTVEYLREKLNSKNEEIECLNDQLRRAVSTKCDLVLAQAELEQCHDTAVAKRREDLKELKHQNYTLLEEYSMKEKELLTELLTLSSKLKSAENRHRDEMDDLERIHRNQILEKDYQIAQLTVELQTAKMKYEACKQDLANGLGVSRKPRRKTTIKKIFHTQ